jgi:hypothetical protein
MIEVSNHSLCEVAKCETMAFVHKIVGLTSIRTPADESPWIVAGKAVHEARQAHLSKMSMPECLSLFEQRYQSYASLTEQNGKYSHENIYRNLSTFLSNTQPWVDEHTCLATEWKFSIPISYDIRFIGYIDAILQRTNTQVIFPYELKTRGSDSIWWSRKWSTDPQPTGYLIALQEMWTDLLVTDSIVEVLYFENLKYGKGKCRLHSLPYDECQSLHVKHERLSVPRSSEDISLWWVETRRQASRLKTLQDVWSTQDFNLYDTMIDRSGIHTDSCMFCDCVPFCRAGRPWHRWEDFFTPRIPQHQPETLDPNL